MELIRSVDRNVGRTLVLLLLTLWNLMGVESLVVPLSSPPPTPINMEEMVIGRCEEYQRVVRPELFQKNELKNCKDLWLKLRKAFADKEPCDLTVDSYQEFIDAAYHKFDTQDKVMLWSGQVFPMVTDFVQVKGKQYTTIRDILPAYMVVNIENWCGKVASPGINYAECPAKETCPVSPFTLFWTAMSKNFAKQLRGTVHVMLNGSVDEPYRRSSIFAQSELTNLDASRTPILHVHLVYPVSGKLKERCGEGTMALLREDVEKKGMKFKCSDDDLDILHFQCATDTQGNRCTVIGTG